jgi:hypothetical protein
MGKYVRQRDARLAGEAGKPYWLSVLCALFSVLSSVFCVLCSVF